MVENNYIISKKYNKKIALFADIHFYKKYNKKIFEKILSSLIKNKPDYICIPGDIIDDSEALNSVNIELLINFIKELGRIAPTILSYGNHDELVRKNDNIKGINCFFNKLNELNNVYFLDNNNIVIDNINFIGFHPNYLYYINGEKKYDLSKELNKLKQKIISDKYNILLCHSPITILNYDFKVELILSGHMHNGLLPSFLKIKGNRGLIGPFRKPFPKLSRGIVKKKDTSLIITGGVIKFSNSAIKLLKPLNLIYQIDIDYIEI